MSSKVWSRVKEIAYPSEITIIGAGMGLVSLFLPWAGREPNYLVHIPPPGMHWGDPSQAFPYATEYGFLDLAGWSSGINLFLMIFLTGTLLALVTRLGGLLQAVGLMGFGIEFGDFILRFRSQALPWSTSQFEFFLSSGCVLAAISTFVVVFAGRKRALENPACGCVPCLARVGAIAPRAARIRTS